MRKCEVFGRRENEFRENLNSTCKTSYEGSRTCYAWGFLMTWITRWRSTAMTRMLRTLIQGGGDHRGRSIKKWGIPKEARPSRETGRWRANKDIQSSVHWILSSGSHTTGFAEMKRERKGSWKAKAGWVLKSNKRPNHFDCGHRHIRNWKLKT